MSCNQALYWRIGTKGNMMSLLAESFHPWRAYGEQKVCLFLCPYSLALIPVMTAQWAHAQITVSGLALLSFISEA